MGELKIKLPDELEKVFRKLAMKRYGYIKGAMSAAAKEAIGVWTKLEEGGELTKEDLWDELEGAMKHVKKSSVQLQHEAWSYMTDKYYKFKRKK